MKYYNSISRLLLLLMCSLISISGISQQKQTNDYTSLVSLFKDWRAFEKPSLLKGAPDYTALNFNKRWTAFKLLQSKLNRIDTSSWTIEHKVDWMLVWAEMNGYDFNHRVLKPWTRDPAFYKTIFTERSDVPAHEGPTHHAIIDVWKYTFPLSVAEKNNLINQLKVIEPLNEQAKLNLTGNAKELWIAGISDIQSQNDDLKELLAKPEERIWLKKFLQDNKLYIFTVNAFPYGPFKGELVKERVYEPDWTTQARTQYTMHIADILAALLNVAKWCGMLFKTPGALYGLEPL